MTSLNRVMLIGRIGKLNDLYELESGNTVLSLSIATDEYKDGEVSATDWHRIVVWNNTASFVQEYCPLGSLIFVEGKLKIRKWEDDDGNNRYTTEINCYKLLLLSTPKQKEVKKPAKKPSKTVKKPSSKPKQPPIDDFIEDDITF